MSDLETMIMFSIIGLVLGFFVGGIVFDNDQQIKQEICKQLYTNTNDYINCNTNTITIDDVISRIQEIK